MKKLAILAGCAALFGALALPSVAEEGLVKVGGHMKGPVLTDNVWGKVMVDGVKSDGSYSAGSYFSTHAFQLYISKDITENVSVHAVPDFGSAGAGASPSLGKKMGETLKDTGGATAYKFQELTASLNMTELGVQLKAGYMSLPFTQDYGKELFWHEEHNGGKFTLASSWHDTGLEIYKAFELGADGVLVAGCHPADCHYINGNEKAAMRGDFLSSFLEDAGIESQRFRIEWIAGSEGQKFAKVVKDMVSELQRLGPIYAEEG